MDSILRYLHDNSLSHLWCHLNTCLKLLTFQVSTNIHPIELYTKLGSLQLHLLIFSPTGVSALRYITYEKNRKFKHPYHYQKVWNFIHYIRFFHFVLWQIIQHSGKPNLLPKHTASCTTLHSCQYGLPLIIKIHSAVKMDDLLCSVGCYLALVLQLAKTVSAFKAICLSLSFLANP